MIKKEKQEIEIELEDIKIIMQDNFNHFQEILDNCFCPKCPKTVTTIVNYKAYLNHLNDIILRGSCIRCAHNVARYIETGEQIEMAEVAEHIRFIKKNFITK